MGEGKRGCRAPVVRASAPIQLPRHPIQLIQILALDVQRGISLFITGLVRAMPFDIVSPMTKEQMKKVFDRVLTWPPERQADLAHIAELMEEQDSSPLRLSEEQAAEVRRRMADPNPETMTLAEFNERLKLRYGI
jgi:hypothetical protein